MNWLIECTWCTWRTELSALEIERLRRFSVYYCLQAQHRRSCMEKKFSEFRNPSRILQTQKYRWNNDVDDDDDGKPYDTPSRFELTGELPNRTGFMLFFVFGHKIVIMISSHVFQYFFCFVFFFVSEFSRCQCTMLVEWAINCCNAST